jgi:hypothetical protein
LDDMTDAQPHVDGPVPGKAFTAYASFDLAALGYQEEEYFLSGHAQAYEIDGERSGDGHWTATPKGRADYTTRLVVRRPVDTARFNGTVTVEWLNVSAGTDAEPDWACTHRHLARGGFAWVGVSAQKAGIDGGGLAAGPHLRSIDPGRYETLNHPGDAFAYDMFTQAGRILRDSSGGGVLGSLSPARLVAMGESQSAAFLVTYINAIDPIAHVYDGFMVHGRGAAGAQMDGFRLPAVTTDGQPPDLEAARAATFKTPERIRDDVRVPVLTLQSETDVAGMGGALARQPDNERFRLWEVAGAAHADTYLIQGAFQDTGQLSSAELAAALAPITAVHGFNTGTPINSGPQQHYVSQAALAHLDNWIRTGAAPPEAQRLELTESGAFVTDEHGIAVGGIRTPWVDVPVAMLSGLGQEGGAGFTFLFGSTRPFSTDDLERLYPGGLTSYVKQFEESLSQAVGNGFILDADAPEIQGLAAAAYPT